MHTGYQMNDTYVASLYDNVPAGNNCWRWTTCSYSEVYLCGSNLNDPVDGGDPNDPYVIIQVCQDVPTVLYQPYIFIDDIAIAIY